MKYNLVQLLAQCEYELASIGVITGTVKEIKYNPRLTSTWGRCKKAGNGCFVIELSKVHEKIAEKFIKDSIIHELLHTCKGCYNHGAEWKRLAQKVNEAYGYNIKRTATDSEMGLSEIQTCKHLLKCEKCGDRFPRMRTDTAVKNPSRFSCHCGGKLIKIF